MQACACLSIGVPFDMFQRDAVVLYVLLNLRALAVVLLIRGTDPEICSNHMNTSAREHTTIRTNRVSYYCPICGWGRQSFFLGNRANRTAMLARPYLAGCSFTSA